MKTTNPSSSSRANSFDREQYLYLTTRGRRTGQAREIEIWFTHRAGRFYVIAEYATARWLGNIGADSSVQFRVGRESFVGEARVLSAEADRDLLAEIQKLSRQKYGWGDGTVVELAPDGVGGEGGIPAPKPE